MKPDCRSKKGFTQVVDFCEALRGRGKAASRKFTTGFTLIEILLVVAAIAILAGIVIVAINPTRQLGATKDAKRQADVNTILNAVYQYALDNNGSIPTEITTASQQICASGVASSTCATATMINLQNITHAEKYITSVPLNPSATTTNGTGYYIKKSANGRVTVWAEGDQTPLISVTR